MNAPKKPMGWAGFWIWQVVGLVISISLAAGLGLFFLPMVSVVVMVLSALDHKKAWRIFELETQAVQAQQYIQYLESPQQYNPIPQTPNGI